MADKLQALREREAIAEEMRLIEQREAQAAAGQKFGTEHRSGSRKVSDTENIANLMEAQDGQDGQAGTGKSQSQRWPIGATAVGIGAALAVGAATKSVPLAMSAAVLAGGAGDLAQSGVEEAFDLPTKGKDVSEILKRAAFEGVAGGIGEGLGRVPIAAAKKMGLLNFFKKSVTPDSERAMRFLEAKGLEGPTLLPAMATENRPLDILHNFTEHAIIGGGAVRSHNIKSSKFMGQLADESINRLAPLLDEESAAKLLVVAAKKGKDIFHAPAGILYNSVEAAVAPTVTRVNGERITTGGLRTNIKALKEFIDPLIAQQERLGSIGDATTGGSILDIIDGHPNKPQVSDMIQLTRIIRTQKEGLQANIGTKNDPKIGILKQIEKRLHESINKTLLAHKPHLRAAKGEADRLYKFGSKTYNNRVIRGLARKIDFEKPGFAPEQVVKSIFAPGHTARMEVVKGAVDEKTWKTIAARGMQRVLDRSKDDATGNINGQQLLKSLLGKGGDGGLGEKGLVTAVGPIEAQRWIGLARAIKVQQSKQGASEGSMLVQLQQGGVLLAGAAAIGGAAIGEGDVTSAGLGAGALFLGLPVIAGRIMTNPTAAKALIEGMSTTQKASASKVAGIIGRIVQATIPRQTEKQPSQPTPISTALNQTGLSPLSGTPFGNAVQR